MTEHTPDTEHVRSKYSRGMRSDGTPATFEKWRNEFDRWLVEYEARVLREAAEAWSGSEQEPDGPDLNPGRDIRNRARNGAALLARARADSIERGELS